MIKKVMLCFIFVFTLTACDHKDYKPYFEFQNDSIQYEYEEDVISSNVSEEFKDFIANNHIEDVRFINDITYILYSSEETMYLQSYDSDFLLQWEKEFLDLNMRFEGVLAEGVFVTSEFNLFTEEVQFYNNQGEYIDKFVSDRNDFWIIDDIAYGLEFLKNPDTEEYGYVYSRMTLDGKVTLHTQDGDYAQTRVYDDEFLLLLTNFDEDILLNIITFEGEMIFEEHYTNSEDIYKFANGFLVDDEKNSRAELRDNNGNLMWTVEGLTEGVQGIKFKDDKLIIKSGDELFIVSSIGDITSVIPSVSFSSLSDIEENLEDGTQITSFCYADFSSLSGCDVTATSLDGEILWGISEDIAIDVYVVEELIYIQEEEVTNFYDFEGMLEGTIRSSKRVVATFESDQVIVYDEESGFVSRINHDGTVLYDIEIGKLERVHNISDSLTGFTILKEDEVVISGIHEVILVNEEGRIVNRIGGDNFYARIVYMDMSKIYVYTDVYFVDYSYTNRKLYKIDLRGNIISEYSLIDRTNGSYYIIKGNQIIDVTLPYAKSVRIY